MNIHGAAALPFAADVGTVQHLLWYRRPAATWNEALPIGNGRIGGMCFGRPLDDVIGLNDDRGWSGSPASEFAAGTVSAEEASAALTTARSAVRDGAIQVVEDALRSIQQRYSQSFLPLADLHIRVRGNSGGTQIVEGYHRRLDLHTATHRHEYLLNGHRFVQDAFASHPAGVLVLDLRSDAPEGVEVRLRLTTPHVPTGHRRLGDGVAILTRLPSDVAPPHEPDQPDAVWDDSTGLAQRAATVLITTGDGSIDLDGDALLLRGVTHATVALATATTFNGFGLPLADDLEPGLDEAVSRARAAAARGASALRGEHAADHVALYDRVELTFDGDDSSDFLPTDERLRSAIEQAETSASLDARLLALLFHYGRYLLIASSRPGTTPTNLQGIWNDRMRPPWSSNYTMNINTQMNYWGVEVANLRELHEPLFDFIEALAGSGTETSTRLYSARGWVAHHNSDLWCYTSPVGMGRGDIAWAWWPMAGPWLSSHFGTHLEFGADEAFARERAWPVVSSCAEFLLDWLEEDEDGYLGTPLSTSPENCYTLPDNQRCSVARSSTMDLSLTREVFRLVVRLDADLGLGSDVARACAAALPLLRPVAIGADGRILEWPHGLPDREVHHRHVSHLFGLYPGTEKWDARTIAAASHSLDVRGDDASGWSLAWKIALRARLREPDAVEALLRLFFRTPDLSKNDSAGSLYPNLFQTSPPFQIDANFGLVGALPEVLLQSHSGVIDLLPALPAALASGSATGLVARPGVVVDLAWSERRLTSARLTARQETATRVRWPGGERDIALRAGEAVTIQIAATS